LSRFAGVTAQHLTGGDKPQITEVDERELRSH